MWISEEQKYVRKTLKTTHLDTAVGRAENEFFKIKANVNAGRRIFSPTVQQAADEYLKYRWNVDDIDDFLKGKVISEETEEHLIAIFTRTQHKRLPIATFYD